MRRYRIIDHTHNKQAELSLLRLTDATAFEPAQFDQVASLRVGETLKLDEHLSVQRIATAEDEAMVLLPRKATREITREMLEALAGEGLTAEECEALTRRYKDVIAAFCHKASCGAGATGQSGLRCNPASPSAPEVIAPVGFLIEWNRVAKVPDREFRLLRAEAMTLKQELDKNGWLDVIVLSLYVGAAIK